MKIEELLNKEIEEQIEAFKDFELNEKALELIKDWNPKLHNIVTDKVRYPDRRVLEKEGKVGFVNDRRKETPPVYKTEPINRLPLALEQEIVNTHTYFTVGTEPSIECTPNDEKESTLLDILYDLLDDNKTKYKNKKIVRSWLSQTMVAEYWYYDENDNFFKRMFKKHGLNNAPKGGLKSVVWSPFDGDKLYPMYDEYGKMIAFGRGFTKYKDGEDIDSFTIITDDKIYEYDNVDGWVSVRETAHKFGKIPIIYGQRDEALYENIRALRERLEAVCSKYADSIDYNFLPYLLLFGQVANPESATKTRIINISDKQGDAKYLQWTQLPETIRLEMTNMISQIYSLTNTPRISFENMQSLNTPPSGTAFKLMFMSIHGAVENHAEVIGEFFQRRLNLLIAGLGNIISYLKDASETISVNTNIIPYMIDDILNRVKTAKEAIDGKVWSIRKGMEYCNDSDDFDEEYDMILDENGIKIDE